MTILTSVSLASYSSTVKPSSVPDNLPNSASTNISFEWANNDMNFVYATFSSNERCEPSTIIELNPWNCFIQTYNTLEKYRDNKAITDHKCMSHHLWYWICAVSTSRNENYQFKSFHKILLWSSMIKMNSDGNLIKILIVKFNNTQTNIYPSLNTDLRALLTHTWSLQIQYLTSSFILLIDTSFFWVIHRNMKHQVFLYFLKTFPVL